MPRESLVAHLSEVANLHDIVADTTSRKDKDFTVAGPVTVPGIEPLSLPPIGINEQFPWITDQLRQGNTIKWSRIPDDLPEQAAKEKEYAAKTGAKSVLNIPVLVGGSVICTISFTSIRTIAIGLTIHPQ